MTPEYFNRADGGSIAARREANEEFRSFVHGTYIQLLDYEKRRQAGIPSIAIFCRLDVGIMEQGGKAHYFVNEVERSITTSMWMDSMPDGHHGILADSIAVGLHQWLTGMTDPMHI